MPPIAPRPGSPRPDARTPRARVLWVRRVAATSVVAAAAVVGAGSPALGGAGPAEGPQVRVLSTRADLVTGGDALVEVVSPGRALRVTVDGRDVTAAFERRADGRTTGLVTGLRAGRNRLVASTVHGWWRRTGRLVITNHPAGGPLFSGPQVQPWDCDLKPTQTGLGAPRDAQCSTPAVVRYVYRRAGGGFAPYDPAAPPADVASTTTDHGVTVPFVVRLETGVLNRGIYRTAVLADPARPASPGQPPTGWNRKVLWPFGGGSSPQHVTGLPPDVLDAAALGRGFLVASSGLNVHGQNVNTVVSAETVTMLKEHVVETFGPIRYTIGAGCSGGSIQQHVIADQYPGLLDGILPGCSYPDTWTTSTEVQDCALLNRYFAAAGGWTEAQRAAVAGTQDTTVCAYWQFAFVPVTTPYRAQNCGWAAGDPRVYDPVRNPAGTRCGVPDYQVAVWGRRPAAVWTDAERAAGRGFANVAADNDGVLYGLEALRAGAISAEQFTDLNERIGGGTIDGDPQPGRSIADPQTLRTAYRAGQVTQGHRLDEVPIIDLRGSANSRDLHTDVHSWEMRARLDAANGHHDNQVIWTWRAGGNFAGIQPPAAIERAALDTMDAWLAGVEADRRPLPRSLKVRLHRPAAARDTCWPDGVPVTGPGVPDPGYRGECGTAFPYFGDARQAAGQPLAGLSLKCALRPLRPDDVPGLDATQRARLGAALPRGVCDWTRPPVGLRPSLPWMSFAAGPGGRPLGPAPRSVRW